MGLRAGLAVFARRPADILEVTFTRSVRAEVGPLCRWATAERVRCEEVDDAQIERLAGSGQSEGLCILTRPRKWATMREFGELLTRSRGAAVALDRVRNPYNVGAILRSAAFFGIDAAIVGAPAPLPGLSSLAVRVAEGGAEHIGLARTTDLADTLARLRPLGVRVIGADASAKATHTAPVFGRPAVLVLGNEREGMADRVRSQCDDLVAVRGAGGVESLNVAVAAGILLAEMVRPRG